MLVSNVENVMTEVIFVRKKRDVVNTNEFFKDSE
jgi:hypothetical protein